MTAHQVRPARPADHAAVSLFTADTFAWGDYVAGSFLEWLGADDSEVLVAVDVNDVAIGVSRAVLLSPREVWLHAARVHPDHRRKGIGLALNDASVRWGRARGAVVTGLLTEDDNTAARSQVAKIGYREVAHWFYGFQTIDPGTRDPGATGVSAAEAPQPLTTAPAVDIEPAYLTWSRSELASAAHGMIPLGWALRRMSIDDLVTAVRDATMFEAPAGWVVMVPDGENAVRIPWLVTIADDAYSFVRAITARAAADDMNHVAMLLPRVPWLATAAERAGYEIHTNTVWHLEI